MLRNCYKIAYSGLISIILVACQSTRPLLSSGPEIGHCGEDSVIIDAEPADKFLIESKLKHMLRIYGFDFNKYNIKVEIAEYTEPAAFTGKQVVKEQIRIAARVTLYDKEFTQIASKVHDSFTTYEVSDTLPYSALTSKRQTRLTVLDDLVNGTVLQVVQMVREHEQSS